MMRCPNCSCELSKRYDDGNNWNLSCDNKECPMIRELGMIADDYHVIDNWWFLAGYRITFKIDDQWHCMSGPYNYWQDVSGATFHCNEHIKLFSYVSGTTRRGKPYFERQEICMIPYSALPNNDDFSAEFEKLKDRIINKLLVLA